jgi:hypothetical protein
MRPYSLIFYNPGDEDAQRLFVINPWCDFFAFAVKKSGHKGARLGTWLATKGNLINKGGNSKVVRIIAMVKSSL